MLGVNVVCHAGTEKVRKMFISFGIVVTAEGVK